MKINIKVNITPVAKQSVTQGRNRHTGGKTWYNPKQQYCDNLLLLIRSQVPKGFGTMCGAVQVNKLIYTFPYLKSHYRTGKHSNELKPNVPYYHIKKPDFVDNLNKPLFDCLTKASVIKDDSIVCKYSKGGDFYKIYGKVPSIEVELETIINIKE